MLGAKIQVCAMTALVFGKDNGRHVDFCFIEFKFLLFPNWNYMNVPTHFHSLVSVLSGSSFVANDIRGGMSLVLAGLAAEGTTEINGFAHIDRGYENLDMKLHSLGAEVKRLMHLAS